VFLHSVYKTLALSGFCNDNMSFVAQKVVFVNPRHVLSNGRGVLLCVYVGFVPGEFLSAFASRRTLLFAKVFFVASHFFEKLGRFTQKKSL
jgi:hypothetical protein